MNYGKHKTERPEDVVITKEEWDKANADLKEFGHVGVGRWYRQMDASLREACFIIGAMLCTSDCNCKTCQRATDFLFVVDGQTRNTVEYQYD